MTSPIRPTGHRVASSLAPAGDFGARVLNHSLVAAPFATARALAITPRILSPYRDQVRAVSTRIGEVISDNALKIGAKLALTTMKGQAKFFVAGSEDYTLARPPLALMDEFLARTEAGGPPLPVSQESLLTLGKVERELSARYNRISEVATPLNDLERVAVALIDASEWILKMQS